MSGVHITDTRCETYATACAIFAMGFAICFDIMDTADTAESITTVTTTAVTRPNTTGP